MDKHLPDWYYYFHMDLCYESPTINWMAVGAIRFSYIPPPWVCVVVKDKGIAKWKRVVITLFLMYFTPT